MRTMAQTVSLRLRVDGNDVEGESTVSSHDRQDTIECSSFEDSVTAAFEGSTAMLTGRREYQPIKIVKRIDKSTPILAKALCNNEVVEADFRFFRPSVSGSGSEEHFLTINITGGRIASIKRKSQDAITGGEDASPMLEEVAFVFHDITWTYEITGATHMDTWSESV